MKRATIRSIAEAAKTSPATVSHVIHNTRYVSPELRKQVEEVLKKFNYETPFNMHEAPLRETKIIAIFIPNLSNTFFTSFVVRIDPLLREKGYTPLVINTNESKELEKKYLGMLTTIMPDGLILASTFTDYTSLKKFFPPDLPVVFFDRQLLNCPHDMITINTYDALCSAIETFILGGHKKISFISATYQSPVVEERTCAYRDTIRKYSLKEYISYMSTPFGYDIYTKTKEHMNQGCTAIVASNSITTEKTINALFRLGKRLGRDVDILTCPDSTENEIYSFLSRAQIMQPIAELARATTNAVCERIAHSELPVRHTKLQAYVSYSDQQEL